MDDNLDPVIPVVPEVPTPIKRNTFQLMKDTWKGFSNKQKGQLIAVFALVLGLPAILGGVYTVKLIGSRASTLITPPSTPPPPTPTFHPTPTPPVPTIYPSIKPTPRPTVNPTPTPVQLITCQKCNCGCIPQNSTCTVNKKIICTQQQYSCVYTNGACRASSNSSQ